MVTVGIRELKNNLSRYLRRVQAGERIAVTERGRVVAELRPPEPEEKPRNRLDELIASGRARAPLKQGSLTENWPNPPIRLPKGTAKALIDEDRGD